MPTPKQFHDAKARKAPAAKSNSTRRILHIINSDEEVESHDGQRQPTDSDEREDDSDDKKEDDSEVDNGDLAQDEDNDLRHLHASQVKATLQQEVKCHLLDLKICSQCLFISVSHVGKYATSATRTTQTFHTFFKPNCC